MSVTPDEKWRLKAHPSIPRPDKPLLVVVLDGWGEGPHDDEFNAIRQADTPCMDALKDGAPRRWRLLKAHGTAVGLPSDDDMGNSEVWRATCVIMHWAIERPALSAVSHAYANLGMPLSSECTGPCAALQRPPLVAALVAVTAGAPEPVYSRFSAACAPRSAVGGRCRPARGAPRR